MEVAESIVDPGVVLVYNNGIYNTYRDLSLFGSLRKSFERNDPIVKFICSIEASHLLVVA